MESCNSDCIPLIISDIEHLFICLLVICMSSFGEMPFLKKKIRLFNSFVTDLYEMFVYSEKLSPCWSHYLQIFSPSP